MGLFVPAREQTSLKTSPRTVALVPAAGRGLRMGGHIPKQFLSLGGQPILVQSLRILQASPVIHEIILAVPQAEHQYCLDYILATGEFGKVMKIVPGERSDKIRSVVPWRKWVRTRRLSWFTMPCAPS